jgi:hypothetical protein
MRPDKQDQPDHERFHSGSGLTSDQDEDGQPKDRQAQPGSDRKDFSSSHLL